MLQEAQSDPRSRTSCELLIGRAFLEDGAYGQAAAVLSEALNRYELTDEHSKQLLYWLGRAHAAEGNAQEAKDAFGRLLRQDYNFMDGDARQRLDELNKASKG
jgi:tetratricopeptide (TPR) repeat protein